MITTKAEWPTGTVNLSWLPSKSTDLPVTGSHGFCFGASGVFVVNIRTRGYTIPGGHVEADESPGQCLIREVREEANLVVKELELLGFVISDHTENPKYSGPYPVLAAQGMFAAKVAEAGVFHPTEEAIERMEIPINELSSQHHEWNAVLEAAFEEAKRVAATA